MALPDVTRLPRLSGNRLTIRFGELGINRQSLREMTEGEDNLRGPLTPTRETAFSDDPAQVLVRAFFCATPSGQADVAGALGEDLLAATIDAGLLVTAGEKAFACPFHVRPVRDLFLWSDYVHANADPDAVMGAGETTSVLYRAACPRRRIGSALDLGCGAGTLALLLAADADRVIGTDINERAIAFARANATLNGIGDVEFRGGDLYEPVQGDEFDLIVSQPPYYPAVPGREKTFLHGGRRGDELPGRVVEGARSHIAPHGRALIFSSWPADRTLVPIPGFRILELRTSRSEPLGTRQSITIFEHEHSARGVEWAARFEVPADCWGYAQAGRIDEILATQDLLHAGGDAIRRARLRLVTGAELWCEGDDSYLRCPPESLVGWVPVDRDTWSAIKSIDTGAAPSVDVATRALASGWLVPVAYSIT